MRSKLVSYLQSVNTPLKQATLCFLMKDDQILLAMKKRGFGQGKFNGVGGKKNPDETIDTAAKREIEEEIGVIVEQLDQVATIDFYFPHQPDWNQRVVVFITRKWKNQPVESEEMAPQWFKFSGIPYSQMWSDDHLWLPLILQGQKIQAAFLFDKNEGIIDFQIKTLNPI